MILSPLLHVLAVLQHFVYIVIEIALLLRLFGFSLSLGLLVKPVFALLRVLGLLVCPVFALLLIPLSLFAVTLSLGLLILPVLALLLGLGLLVLPFLAFLLSLGLLVCPIRGVIRPSVWHKHAQHTQANKRAENPQSDNLHGCQLPFV
ncbi:MAG TPA: hypothetical protein VGY55_12955 [Pirellulales bacterium]|nr:hypothetical protein [Pirellulales bacterium]